MSEMLFFDQVVAGYGNAVVLDRLGFALKQGQSLAVLDREERIRGAVDYQRGGLEVAGVGGGRRPHI